MKTNQVFFNPPKKVRCVNECGSLFKGEIYEVSEEYTPYGGGDPHYWVLSTSMGWLKSRFEDVVEGEPTTSSPTITQAPSEPPFDFDAYNGIRR